MVAVLTCLPVPQGKADIFGEGGLVGNAFRELGKVTGRDEFREIGDSLDATSKGVKDDVHLYRDIEEGLSKGASGIAQKASDDPVGTIAVVAVAYFAWSTCVDGCQFMVGLTDGLGATVATVGLFSAGGETARSLPSGKGRAQQDMDTTEPEHVEDAAAEPESSSEGTSASASPMPHEAEHQAEPESDIPMEIFTREIYPGGFSKVDHPNGPPPVIVYRSFDETMTSSMMFNSFAFPADAAEWRISGEKDPGGGTLQNPRNDNISPKVAAAFEQARRSHGGLDFLLPKDIPLTAVMTGRVSYITKRDNGLDTITIVAPDSTTAQMLYVRTDPGLKVGDQVEAGKSPVGHSTDIHVKYPKSVPNHVHVQFIDPFGRRFDPWRNAVIVDPPGNTGN